MKAQTVFNRVVKHLLTQKKRAALDDGSCAYLTDKGLRCAVGCLIPKKLYHPRMEGQSVEIVFLLFPQLAEKLGNKDLLGKLQGIHDDPDIYPSRWPQKLRRLAKEEGLEYNEPT